MRRSTWTGLRAAGVLCAALALAGCGSSAAQRPHDSLLPLATPTSVSIGTARLPGLGTVLVDATGHALYMFPPDAGRGVTCTGACAGTWPPVTITAGHRADAVTPAQSARLGTTADPNSGQDVVTYAGYPLYRYAGEVDPHTAHGQALINDGGPWYVLSPTGHPVTVNPYEQR